MLHKKDDPKHRYAGDYAKGLEEGFGVREVRHSLVGSDGKFQEMMTVWMDTPYTYEGRPLKGHAEVYPGFPVPTEGMFCTSGTELWTEDGRNMEDVWAESGKEGGFIVQGPDGSDVACGDAWAKLGVFSSAAAHYPSVMNYGEYMAYQERNRASMADKGVNLPEASDGDYIKYLESQKALMSGGNMKFVGDVTAPHQVDAMIETYKGYAEMDAYYAEHPEECQVFGE